MAHPALPLQNAIFTALKDDEFITSVVGEGDDARIYDHVPEDAQMPYIVIGDDSFSRDLWRHECLVSIWVFTADVGVVAVKELAGFVQETLDRELIVDGYDTIEYSHEDIEFFKEQGGQVQMAEVGFRYLLEPETYWADQEDTTAP